MHRYCTSNKCYYHGELETCPICESKTKEIHNGKKTLASGLSYKDPKTVLLIRPIAEDDPEYKLYRYYNFSNQIGYDVKRWSNEDTHYIQSEYPYRAVINYEDWEKTIPSTVIPENEPAAYSRKPFEPDGSFPKKPGRIKW
jgi:hypothetical protein